MEADAVNHPNHYTSGGIECIDAIREALGEDGFRAYCKGNVIKYVWREGHKGGDEDLRKGRIQTTPNHYHEMIDLGYDEQENPFDSTNPYCPCFTPLSELEEI